MLFLIGATYIKRIKLLKLTWIGGRVILSYEFSGE